MTMTNAFYNDDRFNVNDDPRTNDFCWLTFNETQVAMYRTLLSKHNNVFTVLGTKAYDEIDDNDDLRYFEQSRYHTTTANICRAERINVLRFDESRATFLICSGEQKIRVVTYDRKRFVMRVTDNNNYNRVRNVTAPLFGRLPSSAVQSSALLRRLNVDTNDDDDDDRSDAQTNGLVNVGPITNVDHLFRLSNNEQLAAWTLISPMINNDVPTANDSRMVNSSLAANIRRFGSPLTTFILLTGSEYRRTDRSNHWNELKLCIHDTVVTTGFIVPRDRTSANFCNGRSRSIRYIVPSSLVNSRFCAHSVKHAKNIITFVVEHKNVSLSSNFQHYVRIWLYINNTYSGSFNLPNCKHCERVSKVERIRVGSPGTNNSDNNNNVHKEQDELWSMLITDVRGKPIARLWTFASLVEQRIFLTHYNNNFGENKTDSLSQQTIEFKLHVSNVKTERRLYELHVNGVFRAAKKLIEFKFRVIDTNIGLVVLGSHAKQFCRSMYDTLQVCEKIIDETNSLTMRTNVFVPNAMRSALNEHTNTWYRIPCKYLHTNDNQHRDDDSVDNDADHRHFDTIVSNVSSPMYLTISTSVDESTSTTEDDGMVYTTVDDNGQHDDSDSPIITISNVATENNETINFIILVVGLISILVFSIGTFCIMMTIYVRYYK